ncbi:uncharacterized protein LOC107805286 isoform X2 [Nicotiana tabacum]|uniref:Uncharacterized protein LOC107805286 isoform X2 n=1 Tax=Nicotiana tabacum TaxID=4097 RepID=A0AC58TYL6_TOBAC
MDPDTDTGTEIRLKIIQIFKNSVIKICLTYETLCEKLIRYSEKEKILIKRRIQEGDKRKCTNIKNSIHKVLVVRQDLKMAQGKIASQCAHAATGMYAELMQSDRYLLRQWEQCGQPKIVVTCKNQQEMNKLKEAAENIGLPTFVVADAGRTQVASGSRTVLAVGPGSKSAVDSVTGKQRLL